MKIMQKKNTSHAILVLDKHFWIFCSYFFLISWKKGFTMWPTAFQCHEQLKFDPSSQQSEKESFFFCQLLSISKLLRIYSTTKDILQSDNSILLKNRSFYRNRTSHLHVGYLGMDHNNKNQKCWSKILQESKDWKGIHLHHPDNFYLHSNTYFHDIVTRLWQYVYKW